MARRDHQSEVIDLVAEERGLRREKVQLSHRLLQDLGMDGDDAADFFDLVHALFGTDLTQLHDHWRDHFGPEGLSVWSGLVVIPAALIGGLVAGAAGLSAIWAMAIALALIVAWVWAVRRRGPPDRLIPITVGEVAAAVEAGAWSQRFQPTRTSSRT